MSTPLKKKKVWGLEMKNDEILVVEVLKRSARCDDARKSCSDQLHFTGSRSANRQC